jgi:HlyD family secretion protein
VKRAYILPALALLGLVIAITAIIYSNKPARQQAPAILSFQPPYESYIAGAGIVEATTGNIAIGTPVSGVVMEIYVKVGDEVKKGDHLFKIDDRELKAQLVTARAAVKESTAALQKPRHRLENAEQLKKRDPHAISAQDLSDLHDEVALADAALELAKARLSQLQIDIERHTVRALMDGKILQLKMRLGEYVEGSSVSPSLLLLGGNDSMNIRVDINEYDAWRFQTDADAVAYVRGHPELKIPLKYQYTEPYMVPKTALTGESTERTDTRVMQVIYCFEHADLPVYIGQQLDVFIRAKTE